MIEKNIHNNSFHNTHPSQMEEARVDHYDVLEVIGRGSFGKVCKVRRKHDGMILVWKEMNYGTMSQKEKELVVSEVNILKDLNNPFIVKYFDRIVDRTTTKLYIVMEFCAGGDLGKVVKKCKAERTSLDEKVIWKVIAQTVVALKDCHRRKEGGEYKPILHRDIKCANFLLDGQNNVKLGDFGLARELGSGKMAQTNVGTPYYMSPELINEKEYNEKTDIWSLGCLIYELAALRPPFEAANQVALALKITAGKFSRIPMKYSDNLSDLIRSMLQIDPRKRPSVEDFEKCKALESYLRDANHIVRECQVPVATVVKAKANTISMAWIEAKVAELKQKEIELSTKEAQLSEREKLIEARESMLNAREKNYLAREEKLNSTTAKLDVASTSTPSNAPIQHPSFKIYSDQPSDKEKTQEGKAENISTDVSTMQRQQEFLRNQQRMYLKLHDPNISKPILSEGAKGTVGTKRPPPPPPIPRPPMSIPIPPVAFAIHKNHNSDKENVVPKHIKTIASVSSKPALLNRLSSFDKENIDQNLTTAYCSTANEQSKSSTTEPSPAKRARVVYSAAEYLSSKVVAKK